MSNYEEPFRLYKKNHMNIAKDLCYGDEVIAKIRNAKTRNEVDRIMVTARRNRK